MFVTEYMKICRKSNGEVYDCFIQDYESFNGKKCKRFNIGINGYTEWSNLLCIYNEDEFNDQFEVIG